MLTDTSKHTDVWHSVTHSFLGGLLFKVAVFENRNKSTVRSSEALIRESPDPSTSAETSASAPEELKPSNGDYKHICTQQALVYVC